MHHPQTYQELRLCAQSLLCAGDEISLKSLRTRKADLESAARQALSEVSPSLDTENRVALALAAIALDSVSLGSDCLRERLVHAAEKDVEALPEDIGLAELLTCLYDLTRRAEYHAKALDIIRNIPPDGKTAEITDILDNLKGQEDIG